MFIRYFARVDESDLGRAAAVYCDALVATGIPVRLISTCLAQLQIDARGRCSSVWDRHRNLLATPLDSEYVNVVCSDAQDWVRFRTIDVMNVLLVAEPNLIGAVPQLDLIEAVGKYEAICATSSALADAIERITGKRPFTLSDTTFAAIINVGSDLVKRTRGLE